MNIKEFIKENNLLLDGEERAKFHIKHMCRIEYSGYDNIYISFEKMLTPEYSKNLKFTMYIKDTNKILIHYNDDEIWSDQFDNLNINSLEDLYLFGKKLIDNLVFA